nr:cytosolic phospholipase A2 epsilon-like [Pogona vitticeps]
MASSGRAKEMEDSPCYLLTVNVIQIKNLHKADLFNQSDCYVSLYLPTASFETVRTKTIKDCKDPMWNETFCFRIQSQVKNVLELMVHDEEHCLADVHLLTVLFDVSKIRLGETICLTFPLNPKIQEKLEVEFSLESIPVRHEHIVTNGVLVSREISCLEVQANEEKLTKKKSREKKLLFTVQGSYEETREFSLDTELHPAEPLVFHYVKYKDSALETELTRKPYGTDSCFSRKDIDEKVCLTLPLDSGQVEKKINIGKDNTLDLGLKIKDWPKNLDVRLGYDLCTEEKIVIQKRKEIVATALEKALHLQNSLQDHEVPVVAVMSTGGGARAFTALYGNLFGLQKLNLLDCISYITGSSGSTWTLSNLYEHEDWSWQDLSGAIAEARRNMTKSKLGLFSVENIKEYSHALEQRQKQGYKTCITDLWGLLLDKALGNGQCCSTLSGQKRAISHGQNPLPIYMVLNTRDKYSLPEFKEWMEFTPFEVGLLKYGAYINSEDFGSKFFMGRMMKKIPESQICFMKGVWSNVFSYNLLDAWRALDVSEESFWHRYTRDRVKDIEWMEFTPFEVGLLKYGAYINSEDFGSKFFMGRMMKKIPESQICFMKGVWSNVFSYNLLDAWRALDVSEESFWHRYTRDRVKDIEELPPQPPRQQELHTQLVIPAPEFPTFLREIITQRITTSKFYNFLKGFQLSNGYLDNKNFCIWKDTVLDTFPNQLTATSEYLSVVDTAAYLDISYPPLLRPERKVDVIIHLNYSSGSQTKTLDEASRYFSKQGIPFPKVDLSHIKDKDLKECYVFEDPEDAKAPIVVFFPLINDTFRKYKAPGVARSLSELKQGDVDVTSPCSPYGLASFEYSEEDFDKLVELTSYNIQNNKYLILQALQRAIKRKIKSEEMDAKSRHV